MLCAAPSRSFAQVQNYEAERARAFQLMDENKFTEALPILEKLAAAKPNDGQVAFALGFCTFADSKTLKSPEARRQARLRARTQLIHARELGIKDTLLESIVASIPEDGGDELGFSRSKEADAAMQEAESAFSKGELEKAIAAYDRALRADPKLYEAALFAGDSYFKMAHVEKNQARREDELNKADEWFTKAVAIAPDRETAYRYWGDALLEQGKPDEARAKFIEAIVAEPYKQLVYSGISNWANKTQTNLAHPEVKQPDAANPNEKGPGSWQLYYTTRAAWADGRFVKEFPNEKVYRHTLREEAEALRLVAEAAARDLQAGRVKSLDPSLAALVKLNQAGLLEAYILFARPDQGIARDYEAYRQANRDKLRRYWNEFVIGGGK